MKRKDNENKQKLISFEIFKDKPFWFTDKEHNEKDCCFNHIIGLPSKHGKPLPMFDYEMLLYDMLFQTNNSHKDKHLWIKKATGLGVTEFFLRLMAWLCIRNNDYRNSQMCIVTGPNVDMAVKLIVRMKALFEQKLGILFANKETVLELNGCTIEAYPSNHIDSYRSLTNPKFILLDEADFFRKGEQEDVRFVTERYIGKSDPYIVMVSTPNAPGGLFERIEQETDELSLYYRLALDYRKGQNRIYTNEDIDRAKHSPSFEREYNLKYLGSIGNVFAAEDIDYAIRNEYDIIEYLDDATNPPMYQGVMGVDPGWGVSSFGIVVTHFIDGVIRVAYADQHSRQDHNEMISLVWDLIQKFNVTKVLVDASAPSFIRALKLQWGERVDYEQVKAQLREYMKVEPVAFGVEHKPLLYHTKFLLENKYIQIHPTKMNKLITSLRSAWAKEGTLDKEVTSFDDVLDAFRLCLRPYKEKEQ